VQYVLPPLGGLAQRLELRRGPPHSSFASAFQRAAANAA